MARFLRAPLVHFLAAGAMLIALRAPLDAVVGRDDAIGTDEKAAPNAIVIDAIRIDEIRAGFVAQRSRAPDRSELEALVQAAIEEELLAREARARGLDRDDPGIEARLAQKMLFLDGVDADSGARPDEATALAGRARALGLERDDLVVRRILSEKLRLAAGHLAPDEQPSAADLERAYAERAERHREPERRSLTHVFFSQDRRHERAQRDARRLRSQLSESASASERGDAFPLGRAFERVTQSDLERQLGSSFGERVFALEAARWSDPIASAYGFHLVRVDEIVAGGIPRFEELKDQIGRELAAERRERKVAALLAQLRSRYEVAVEWTGEEAK